jgi:thiol-disulfide isomerase/thioredoxin
MKKPWLVIGGVVAVIALATLYLLIMHKPAGQNAPANTTADMPTQKTTATEAPVQTPQETPGTYTAYSAEAVAKTAGRKILFFHAPWCPQCRALEQSIQSETIPAKVTIFKVDYDSSTTLRQKYGVTIQTTLVEVDSNGNLIQKYVAYDTPSLDAVVKALKL